MYINHTHLIKYLETTGWKLKQEFDDSKLYTNKAGQLHVVTDFTVDDYDVALKLSLYRLMQAETKEMDALIFDILRVNSTKEEQVTLDAIKALEGIVATLKDRIYKAPSCTSDWSLKYVTAQLKDLLKTDLNKIGRIDT